jgi:hypothetical protein
MREDRGRIYIACAGGTAGVAELADALDSKSSDRKIVWVRAPPPANSPKRFLPRKVNAPILWIWVISDVVTW